MNWSKIGQSLRTHWFAIGFWLLFGLPTAVFILLSLALLGYTYWPVDYGKVVTPEIAGDRRHTRVIAHGLGDTTASWSEPLRQIFLDADPDAAVIALDWRPWSDSTLRCSVDGLRIGRQLGRQLASTGQLASVHAIGHSCGSFVVLGLCRGLREYGPDIQVQSTYLDPVSIYGGLFWRYGVKHFGECADFSEAYFDASDGVPGSDEPLPRAYSFDVTAARADIAATTAPHVWPTLYYQMLVASGRYPDLGRQPELPKTLPAGQSAQIQQAPTK